MPEVDSLDEVKWREGVVEELKRRGFRDEALRFRDCEEQWYTRRCKGCGRPEEVEGERVVHRFSCELRICDMCARRYADRLYNEVKEMLRHVERRPKWTLKLITLTWRKEKGWPTVGQLGRQVREVGKVMPKVWKKLLEAEGTGVVGAMEIGPSGNVHVHFVYWGPFVMQKVLKKVWFDLTGSWIVDIRKLERVGDIREVTKYVCKIGVFTPEQLVDVFSAFRGVRRVRTYGVFYNRVKGKVRPMVRICEYCGGVEWEIDEWYTAEQLSKLAMIIRIRAA